MPGTPERRVSSADTAPGSEHHALRGEPVGHARQHLLHLPVPVRAGSRYGLFHCCCDYPELSPAENAARRKEWEKFRESYREGWSEKFGKWPEEGEVFWPGHHIRDLKRGGNPVDPSNIFPAKPSVHDIYNRAYPACYDGQPPWNTVGPNLPYTD